MKKGRCRTTNLLLRPPLGAELGKTQAANCCEQHGPSQREEQSDGIGRLQAENTAAGQAEATKDHKGHELNGQLCLLHTANPTVEGESGESQRLGDWYTQPYKRCQVTSPSQLMKHTRMPHGSGRTLAILCCPITAREGVFTLCM